MMPLDQRLEPGLDLLGRGVRLEAERIERLALGIARRAELRQPPLRSAPCAGQSAELPEHAEGIIGPAEIGKAGGMGTRRRPSAVHSHLPGRAMPDDRLLLIAGNVLGAHAGEEIVRVVVFANVIEAEPPIFALAQSPLGRAVGRGRLAIRPFAGWALG